MKRNVLLFGAGVLTLVLCILVAGCTTTTDGPVTVKNDALNIIGLSQDGVDSFLGIPYAEPPVGDLRFAPPVAKKPWTETLDCTQYANAAIQSDRIIGNQPVSEDCLYLNVWKPSSAKEGDNLPVYVWIHGGGWCYGAGSEKLYDGTVFAQDGIVLVTINYRLGGLGYLALDTLMEKYGTAGNWATLDQIMALQWVHDNIAKFGGDPNRVTIGGESAGSFNTFALVMSPKAEGLFQQAIIESGAISYIMENKMRLDKALEIGKKIAAHFGADDSEEGLAILRQVDAKDLWTLTEINLGDLMTGSPYQTYPVYDGVVLPLNDPYQALKDGNYNKNITILMGDNNREGKLFVNQNTLTEESLNAFIKKVYKEDSYQEVIDYYASFPDPLLEKAGENLGMTLISLGVIEAENIMSGQGVPMYVYEFNYTDSYGKNAFHATEIGYAFGQWSKNGKPYVGDDLIVRKNMHAYWCNFIKTGNPNGEGLVEWPKYVEGTQTIMELDVDPALITRSKQATIDFLTPRYFNT